MEYTEITPEEFAALDGLDDWHLVDGPAIAATFRGPSYLDGAELIPVIARIAEDAQHHPDLELLYPGRVQVRLSTHATGGLTTLDADAARAISAAARAAGMPAEPT